MTRISALFVLLGLVMTCAWPLPGKKHFTIDLSSYGAELFGNPQLLITMLPNNVTSSTPSSLTYYDDDNINPEELGEYLEGDILVPESTISMRSSRPKESTTWPNGIVPYLIEGNFPEQAVDTIFRAMEHIQNRSCVIFMPQTIEEDYVSITNLYKGCWSSVGRMGGRQQLNLETPACMRRFGTAVHELLHALGFPHEQNRNKRDEYVVIVKQNIKSEYLKNFRMNKNLENFGTKYDYGSVMHYSQQAFSTNGDPTIVPLKKRKAGVEIGQRLALSNADMSRLNRMYCESEFEIEPKTENEHEPDPKTEIETKTAQSSRLVEPLLKNFFPMLGEETYYIG